MRAAGPLPAGHSNVTGASLPTNGSTPVKEPLAAVEVANIHAGYGRSTVLSDVSITVPPSTVVALLGANGAGKTTLLRILAGLLRPRDGTVRVHGVDVTQAKPHQRAKAGLCLIPEGRGIFRSLTVRENLDLHVPPWSNSRDITPALEAFPVLRERLGQVAGTMSGGQQQMLALARAYLSHPSVVLLDEVSMGLAPLVVDELFESLRALAASGCALLIVEQYVTRAIAMADTAYLLSKGTVVYGGPTAGLDDDVMAQAYLGGAAEMPAEPDDAEPRIEHRTSDP